MPLLDHFHPPLSHQHPWDGMHAAWANQIAVLLNDELLPADYFAIPSIHVEGRVEVDVGMFRDPALAGDAGATVATATWAPPRPTLAFPVESADMDVYEIQVRREMGGPQLRSAIELVSPANKDHPANRRAFAAKCASYLYSGVSVVVVDVVTDRHADLHAELLEILRLSASPAWQSRTNLYAIAYRIVAAAGKNQLEVWPEPLACGAELPTLPLWLDQELCVPLPLEDSYQATRAALRIRE
ncbi:MAG TPA: DUF4058 family protein [Pirellulales bacterium]|nr:DUF4058 family protein [Pirellulales bacterium]